MSFCSSVFIIIFLRFVARVRKCAALASARAFTLFAVFNDFYHRQNHRRQHKGANNNTPNVFYNKVHIFSVNIIDYSFRLTFNAKKFKYYL